ncbi:hypothetical protein VMCG_06413 [Cytospora schulzeri]|uniref:Uncharacterized protein n=1 Tax=Cytospora schulzeri TaxID=448051 RepID=A0A423W851_9PEZI|nr:hypothetical protein VMCG_06413 [Valsa malicola]
MSSNTSTQSIYNTMPNPQNTTGARYHLMQTLGQGIQRVPLPHLTEFARRTARLQRRRHQLQLSLAQGANRNTNAHGACPRQRHNTIHVRDTEFERRLEDQAKQIERNLKRYGNSDPKELILKANIYVLENILRACEPKQLQAMHELAVALDEANEGVPAHAAGIFNTVLGRDINLPLNARTFEIAIR